jgi:cytochrome c-type biogenesis protein CcmH/NrfF
MRSLAVPLAAGALLALAALIGVNLLRPVPTPSRAEIAHQIETQLRCPDCQSLSVADSTSQSAAEIRSQIDQLLAQGLAPEEVRQHFISRYGSWILLAPQATIAWVLPFLVLFAGGVALAVWVWRGRNAAARAAEPVPGEVAGAGPGVDGNRTDAARLAAVRDEAESLDA